MFSPFYHQRLRTQRENSARNSNEIGLIGKLPRFSIVYDQKIYLGERL